LNVIQVTLYLGSIWEVPIKSLFPLIAMSKLTSKQQILSYIILFQVLTTGYLDVKSGLSKAKLLPGTVTEGIPPTTIFILSVILG
jgi:hypothetical protein